MINVTKHALRRYAERFKSIDKELIEQQITLNKDHYQSDLDKMFTNSRLIYTGKFNDKHNKTNFRIVDNIILVTDIMDTKIITLYRIDFGFDRDIDLSITKSLITRLNEAETIYLDTMEKINEEKESLEAKRDGLKEEINTFKQTLKAMEDSLNAMDTYIKNFGYEESQAKSEMDLIAKKIVYSNTYRKEMHECTI